MSATKTIKEQLQAMKKKVTEARTSGNRDMLAQFRRASARLSRRLREEALLAKNKLKKVVAEG